MEGISLKEKVALKRNDNVPWHYTSLNYSQQTVCVNSNEPFFQMLIIPMGGLSWSLNTCVAMLRTIYGPSATDRLLGTVPEESGNSSWFQVSISSRYDLNCWKRRKNPFLTTSIASIFFLFNDFTVVCYVIDRPQGSCGVWDIPKALRGGAE